MFLKVNGSAPPLPGLARDQLDEESISSHLEDTTVVGVVHATGDVVPRWNKK